MRGSRICVRVVVLLFVRNGKIRRNEFVMQVKTRININFIFSPRTKLTFTPVPLFALRHQLQPCSEAVCILSAPEERSTDNRTAPEQLSEAELREGERVAIGNVQIFTAACAALWFCMLSSQHGMLVICSNLVASTTCRRLGMEALLNILPTIDA